MRDRLDVAEAALVEPSVNAGASVEAALDQLAKALAEADPSPETFGKDPISRRNAQAGLDMFKAGKAPKRRAPEPRAAPVAD